MSRPLVSVGLPTCDRAHLLPAALDSLMAQTYPNLEIVISDNCSSDRTPEVCERYSSRHPWIRYSRQSDRVPAMDNFRAALELSSGTYFMWASDDDVWAPTFVEILVAGMESELELALLAAEAQYQLSDGSRLDFFPEGEYWYLPRHETAFDRALAVLRHNFGNLIYGLYRREALINAKGTILDRVSYVNEIPVFLRVAERGGIRVIPEVLFFKTTNLETYRAAAREYRHRPPGLDENRIKERQKNPVHQLYRATRYHLATFKDVALAVLETKFNAIEKARLLCLAATTLFAHLVKVGIVWPAQDLVDFK